MSWIRHIVAESMSPERWPSDAGYTARAVGELTTAERAVFVEASDGRVLIGLARPDGPGVIEETYALRVHDAANMARAMVKAIAVLASRDTTHPANEPPGERGT